MSRYYAKNIYSRYYLNDKIPVKITPRFSVVKIVAHCVIGKMIVLPK